MIFFRPRSQTRRLIEMLAVTGEFPVSSLYLFGSQRTMRELVSRMTEIQQYRNTETGETVTCRLLTLSGKGRNKAVRLLKSGFQILDWFGAREYYEANWREHNLPSDASHREPRFRCAEASVMLILAGVEIRPWWKPPLQTSLGGPLLPGWASFYSSRELKNLWDGEIKKIQYVRMSGLVLSRYGGMAVYNTRDAVMKWSGEGEYKAYLSMSTLAHINTRADSVESAILFGRSEEVALRTIETFRKSRRYDLRFNSTYRYIYFVPLCENGIAQLRLLLLPDWNERLLQAMFAPSQRSNNMGSFEYDGIVDGVYVFEFFDGDIARLEHFRQGIEDRDVQCRVCCFPFQVSLVKSVLGDRVEIDTYEPKTVMEALGAE